MKKSLHTIGLFLFLLTFKSAEAQNVKLGSYALYSNTYGAKITAIGSTSLYYNTTGSYNSALGHASLYKNKTGNHNTGVGTSSLYSSVTGSYNTAVGSHSLNSSSGASNNSALGCYSLFANTTGKENTSIGSASMYSNQTGSYNVAIGFNALFDNTLGENNTAVGKNSLTLNRTGNSNTAVGSKALLRNETGSGNSALGDSAGHSVNVNTSTFLGFKTTVSVAGLNNVTVIGNRASATASNQVRIGNNSITSIGGKVGWTTLSDGRFKQNISDKVPGLAFITKLKPVNYTLNIAALDKATNNGELHSAEEALSREMAAKEMHTGFIAQDVEKIAKEMQFPFSGVDKPKNEHDFYGLRYAEFVVPLVKAVQELDVRDSLVEDQISLLKEENKKLKVELDELRKIVMEIKNGNNHISATTGAYLFQSSPNPGKGNTMIKYYVPKEIVSAKIIFTDLKGSQIRSFSINKGEGMLNFSAASLPAGVYNYSLIVDGLQVDTKRLIITE